jgi:hypothetical protein
VSKVFCIGNGESRKDFDLNILKGKGKVYGCNAIYRDYPDVIDVLTAVDNGIIHEIYHSGYSMKVPCYFRNWSKLPVEMYDQVVAGFLDHQELENLKDYDVIKENKEYKDKATHFVVHGTTLSGMVSIIKNLKKSHPRATKEIIQEKIHKSKIYISWIREDDKAKDVSDCWDKYKDHGWACGASSGFVAINNEKPKELYMIGHDLVSDNHKINNMYKGSTNYQPNDAGATPAVNWINQWYTLMDWNPNIQFFKVNKDIDTTPTNSKIQHWNKWEKDGRLKYITQTQLIDKINK